ncbi:hypothetical protein CERZMDRAFT_91122 [Cercospora zeae-maydis SCOH1-5]|uniref:Uncharacterized protein n=1 Tax=Cercospora zeae-maydis SCOH1-5 TaxID=717836 RepID=A0A6A6FBE5_9PEZI|nr:hypothetical protein CERZMDRAFT_91122 [Cercospora zeae-maydis SCOH1-5]
MFGKLKRRWPMHFPEVMLQSGRIRGHAYPQNSTVGERMVPRTMRQNQKSRMKMKPCERLSHQCPSCISICSRAPSRSQAASPPRESTI